MPRVLAAFSAVFWPTVHRKPGSRGSGLAFPDRQRGRRGDARIRTITRTLAPPGPGGDSRGRGCFPAMDFHKLLKPAALKKLTENGLESALNAVHLWVARETDTIARTKCISSECAGWALGFYYSLPPAWASLCLMRVVPVFPRWAMEMAPQCGRTTHTAIPERRPGLSR